MVIKMGNTTSTDSCEIITGKPCSYIIFGASGDLTARKLLPAVFSLFRTKKIPDNFFLIGFARTIMDDNTFRLKIKDSIRQVYAANSETEINTFTKQCFYIAGSYEQNNDYCQLKGKIKELEKRFETGGNRVFHIATPPTLYTAIITHLGRNSLIEKGRNKDPFHRVIVEKPFGQDLETAINLNHDLLNNLTEEQIYRIDHYLGKETVQNILMFRFSNQLFEAGWNCQHIDHVQITVAEQIGVGNRSGYFEQSGLLRDMFQNHILQLTALVGMEPPIEFSADSIRDEKIKFMRSIRPFDLDNLQQQLVMGQYGAGTTDTETLKAYRQENGVPAKSYTETYFAMKLFVDNWRWKDVPFYIQAGKRLEKKLTRIAIVFKDVPHGMFTRNWKGTRPSPDILILEIQPRQGISFIFQAKVPGSKICMQELKMELDYREFFGKEMNEDYSTLILDCMVGEQTLFWRKDGVITSWELLTPVLENWAAKSHEERDRLLKPYPAGSWGPLAGNRLIEEDGRKWLVT